jgi:Adenylate and Guanylate cyclase catalytic domain
LRIGINLGDVIVEGDDLYGDGVNIAARIEALADAGGVFVSNTVHDHVRDRLPFVFEDLGEQQVKNIARPVRVFRVRTTLIHRALAGWVPPLPQCVQTGEIMDGCSETWWTHPIGIVGLLGRGWDAMVGEVDHVAAV